MASATVISSGGIQLVSAGGIARSVVINVGGNEVVFGSSISATVSNGGSEIVSAGGVASAVVVSTGGSEVVLSGGLASGSVLRTGGSAIVSSGGVASGTIVSSGGTEVVAAGGSARTTTVSSGGVESVLSGGLANGTVVRTGGSAVVQTGGLISGAVVSTGGKTVVSSGGVASRTVLSRGSQVVLSGGIASLTAVSSGGSEVISAGGTTGGTTVSSGGNEVVSSGGLASGTVVSSGGIITVSGGGVLSGISLNSGSKLVEAGLVVGPGTTLTLAPITTSVSNFTVPASGTTSNVVSAVSAIVTSGGSILVFSGGAANTARLSSGGSLTVSSGGLASGTTVLAGGTEFVQATGSAYATTVSSGGSLTVFSKGLASNVTLLTGGAEAVQAGGSALATTVSSGGNLSVSSGGLASSTTVRTGGVEAVQAGGSANVTTVSSGGNEVVSSGGTASTATVSSGGNLTVFSGGLASATTVLSAGIETVYAGGVVSAATLSSGARLVEVGMTIGGGTLMTLRPMTVSSSFSIGSGGTTSNVVSAIGTTVSSGGTLVVSSGSLASATVLSSGGNEIVSAGATDSGITVLSGGTESVLGASTSATVSNGGSQVISGGGVATATIVSSGGAEVALSAGTASGSVLRSGGSAVVSAGGTAKALILSSGGILTVSSGGLTSSTTVSGGGSAAILSGGSASAATLSSGGGLTVFSGGLASATTVLSGGVETVFLGGVMSAATFSSGATLVEVGMAISGGTLMTLRPITTGSSFSIGSGGTTTNVVSAVNTTVGSGGTLVVSAGSLASATVVSSGGGEIVSSGGADSGSVVNTGGSETVYAGGVLSGITLNSGARLIEVGPQVSSGVVLTLAPITALASNVSVPAAGATSNVVSAVSASVMSGGSVGVASGGAASAITVSSGGNLAVSSGGLVSAGTILSGGVTTAFVGGLISGVTFNSGARLVEVGMTISGGTVMALRPISTASSFSVGSGGTTTNVVSAINTTVGSAGSLVISLGGVDSGTTVLNGGSEVVTSGGVASGTVVSTGGNETVYAGGAVAGLTLNSGATLTEVGLLISGVGATLTLAPIAAQVSNVNVPTTGTLSNVVSVVSATAIAGGTVVVSSGGAASVLTVDSGGSLTVSSGGVVSASNILSGGLETTDLGGLSIGAVVGNGGSAVVSSGGTDSNAVVTNGGTETISSGGVANTTSVGSGGAQVVLAGGIASGTVLSAAGVVAVTGGSLVGSSGLALAGGSTLSGFGIINRALSGVGTVTPKGGALDLVGQVSAGPTLAIDSSAPATLKIDSIVAAGAAIAIGSSNQTLEIGAAGSLTIGAAESITAGTIRLGGTLSDAFGLTVGSGGVLTGGGTVDAGTPVILLGGTVDGTGGGLAIAGGLKGVGTISGTLTAASGLTTAEAGTLEITGAVTNGTSLAIDGSTQAVLRLDGTVGPATTISFLGAAGTLELTDVVANSLQFGGMISGLNVGHSATTPINDVNIQGLTVTSAVLANGTITLLDAAATVGTLRLGAPPASGAYAVVRPDGLLGGTDIFVADAPPTITWSPAAAGNAETVLALGTISPASFDGFQSVRISAIPVGLTLTDGTNSFTATTGNTTVDVNAWALSNLSITTADSNFTLVATVTDLAGNVSSTASEQVSVNALAPTVVAVAETGAEGSAIPLSLGITVNHQPADASNLATLIISAIPLGAALSDGTNNFVAAPGNSSVDVASWTLSSLTITPANDVNFTLGVAAEAKDALGNVTTATETVTVNPLAPTVLPLARTGVEGSAIALDLGITIQGLPGDANGLASLVLSAVPDGATLGDGAGHGFTASAGDTSVDIANWTLSGLTIVPTSSTNFTLGVAATAKDAEGNLGGTTTSTEVVTVNPLAPTVAPVPKTGVEGSAIALTLGATVNGVPGDANSFASLVVSAIPVGAVLSDGAGHGFAATTGSTLVDVTNWTLSGLTIVPANSANFTLAVAARAKDAEGNLGGTTTSIEVVTVNPLAPTVVPVAETGVEGSTITLNLGASLNGLPGDANSFAALVVSAVPVGAVLSDGAGHSFTAGTGGTSVDVANWTLSGLRITPAGDVNFTLGIAATAKDAEGNLGGTTTATESVTVTPLAPTVVPVAETGVEGTAIALNLGATVNGLAGDANNFATLVVSSIPLGATLSDGGGHSFTATAGRTSVDVVSWTLSGLTITPTGDANFTLGVAATASDAEGNLGSMTTAIEAVTVSPLAPTVAPVT